MQNKHPSLEHLFACACGWFDYGFLQSHTTNRNVDITGAPLLEDDGLNAG